MNIIEQHIKTITELCKRYKVKTMYLFGSVLSDRFTDKSDVDLLVQFKRMPLKNYADNYYDLHLALQNVFNRRVDLLENQAIRNPVLRRSIDRNKLLIYGREN